MTLDPFASVGGGNNCDRSLHNPTPHEVVMPVILSSADRHKQTAAVGYAVEGSTKGRHRFAVKPVKPVCGVCNDEIEVFVRIAYLDKPSAAVGYPGWKGRRSTTLGLKLNPVHTICR